MDQFLTVNCSPATLKTEIDEPYSTFYFAEENSKPLGFVKLRTQPIPEELTNEQVIEIERLYVLTSHHGKKIGAQLMSHCIQLAQNSGCNYIWLAVWEHNQKAIHFYEKWGFEKFGAKIFVLGTDEQTDFMMKKKLD